MKSDVLSARHLSEVFFLLFLLVKPFYILPSGSFQLGDLCIVLSLLFMFVEYGMTFSVDKIDAPLAAFLFFVIVIDLLYFCIDGSSTFLLYASYYVFNFFVVILFRKIATSEEMLKKIVFVLRVGLAIQVLIWVFGVGRYFGTMRYMGSFNDPNQMGFFVFSSYLFIQLATKKIKLKRFYVEDAVCIFLVIQTASTDMLLGFALIYLVKLVTLCKNATWRGKALYFFSMVLVAILALTVVFPGATIGSIRTGNAQVDVALQRVTEKVEKLSNADGSTYSTSIVIDRALDKVIYYPEKMLYGAGEGNFSRFTQAHAVTELHSTVIGILFYYGIVPFLLLCVWVVKNFKRGNAEYDFILLYLSLLAECMFLANQRQPMLWMLIVLASLEYELDSKKAELQENQNNEPYSLPIDSGYDANRRGWEDECS